MHAPPHSFAKILGRTLTSYCIQEQGHVLRDDSHGRLPRSPDGRLDPCKLNLRLDLKWGAKAAC
jgi:hypothetical protein